ncbi:Rpn family recombination-promoting nuclease/putative transposase [Bacteroides sp. 519]|uniref:Rpn family recombination-promoting nuclease/putative transposase n=1 Tax=Bacteroides sp. 519 TaxID=2302937 RepID=UPI0013D14D64|nr:Rpn family recombination-promoting nuclease/putative transposase [Bacteroides sp. 519]NDV59215.1 Rpn family recombination-promoting nuclease/putative transposase [Bacteroides sp. 519]
MSSSHSLVRFDWAAKRLLRNKSNFVVLEGLLTVLLGEAIHIRRILESEGNQEAYDDKFNRVDMLTENDKGELIIIEIQNNRELDYFHRMLYGTSKTITEYINLGDEYDRVRKVYSINIVYFDLGQGTDYVYHGKTIFKGIHNNDTLQLSVRQRERFIQQEAGDIFPEYYVLRVNDFDQKAIEPLDQWISFLKTGEIDEDATAAGLPEARESLRIDHLSDEERKAYFAHMEAIRYQKSVITTGRYEGYMDGKAEGLQEGRAEGLQEGRAEGLQEGERKKQLEIASVMKAKGISTENIVEITGLTEEDIKNLI